MGVPGEGVLKGLAVTAKTMTRRAGTQQYPDVPPELPPRSRGVIALREENCTVCMLCARECPDWCIYIDSHKEELAAPGAARARQRNVLDRFAIDFSLCMYCGICVEVCPFDALFWSPEFEYAEYDLRDLLHERDRLGEWMTTVPPPPAVDRRGEASKEETAAQRRAAPSGPAGRSGAARRPATAPAGGTPPTRPADAPPTRAADPPQSLPVGPPSAGPGEQPPGGPVGPAAAGPGEQPPEGPVDPPAAGSAGVPAVKPADPPPARPADPPSAEERR